VGLSAGAVSAGVETGQSTAVIEESSIEYILGESNSARGRAPAQEQVADNHTVFVTDNRTGLPLVGARIRGPDGTVLAVTDLWGIATLSDPPANVTVTQEGYHTRENVTLSGRHTDVGLEPVVTDAAMHDLTVFLSNQKTQTEISEEYAITMTELVLDGEAYDVPEDFDEYEAFHDRLDSHAQTSPDGAWAEPVVALLKGEQIDRTTGTPLLPPSVGLGDKTPSDDLLLPEGRYVVQSTTGEFEDASEPIRLNETVIMDFVLEPRTGELTFTLEPTTTGTSGANSGATADVESWEAEEFAVDIRKRDDEGRVVREDTFKVGRNLTHVGELSVEGKQVTIEDYPAGEYEVVVTAQGFETVREGSVEISPDTTTDLSTIELEANHANLKVNVISSLYVDDAGESMDLEGAPVTITGQTGAAAGYTESEETPSNGTVEFEGIPNGQYDVTVGTTEITADGVTARFKPQSLVLNLGRAAATGTSAVTVEAEEPDLGTWQVETDPQQQTVVANLQPTTGLLHGEVIGNGSAQLWPVVTWPNDNSTFAESFGQSPLDDAAIEFEATFDGHDLSLGTGLLDEAELDWTTSRLGVVYGDLPPGEYDVTLEKELEHPVDYEERTVNDVAVNSSGTTILSPDDDPPDRASAEPVVLEREGDYVFGQVRMDVFSENAGIIPSTDHWDAGAGYPPQQFFDPLGGPGYFGPLEGATINFSNDNRTVTLETNQSGQFDAGYLGGGDWEVQVSDTPYDLADASFELSLNGDGEVVGIIVVVEAESDSLDAVHTCEDAGGDTFDCPPGILTITNTVNDQSFLLQEPRSTQLPTEGEYNVHHDDFHDTDDAEPWFFHERVAGGFSIDITDHVEEVDAEERSAELAGYVYNEQTWEPLEGATVTVDGISLGPTDENGYYSRDPLPIDTPVSVDVEVSHESVTNATFRKPEITPGDNRLDLYVEPDAGPLTGVVTDAEGEPVEEVRVTYEGEKTAARGGNRTYTDENGEFTFFLETGTESNATFSFEHPELYPAEGTFDINVTTDGTERIPESGEIRINRTPEPEITDVEFSWADPGESGVTDLPAETHVLSRMGVQDNLTHVNLTLEATRVPEGPIDPSFGAVEPDYGDAEGAREWLHEADPIAETEPGNLSLDHLASDWQLEPTVARVDTTGDSVTLRSTLDLAQIPVTHTEANHRPVTVNLSATTARGQQGWHNRTLSDGGDDGTSIYLNEPPRPLDAVIGDRSSEATSPVLFNAVDQVTFNGTDLDGAYPEIQPDASFKATLSRNDTRGTAPLVYTYELGLGISFSVSEDMEDSSVLLESFGWVVPSKFSTTENVTVANEDVSSSVKTEVGGSIESLKEKIKGLSWAGGAEIDDVTYSLTYESADKYALPPAEGDLVPEYKVGGDVGATTTMEVFELVPQLKPFAAVAKADYGSGLTLGATISGERDGVDAYFGPVKNVTLGLEGLSKFTLGVEVGYGPLEASVAQGTATAKGGLDFEFDETMKPTSIFLNGSLGLSVESLVYDDSVKIAGPGTITMWDLASETGVSVYRVDRDRGLNRGYGDQPGYHTVRGVRTGTIVEAAYPEGVPQQLRGRIAYIHDEQAGSYPGSLQARVLERGAGESAPLAVGGPPLALASNGVDALASSHLPERDSYPVHPMSYLRDAGVSLVDRDADGWSGPVELSPAGGETADLYPALDSTNDTHYVSWRRDRGLGVRPTAASGLAVRAVDRENGTVSPLTVLESSDVVAPADVVATGAGVVVLGVTVSDATATLTAYERDDGGATWTEQTVASARGIGPDTAAVAIDPTTGEPVYAWSNGSAIAVAIPSGGVATVDPNGTVDSLALVIDDDEPLLVWAESGTLVTARPTNESTSPARVAETADSTRISGLSAVATTDGTEFTYAVRTVENGTDVDGRGVDIVHERLDAEEGPPPVVGNQPPRDLNGDGLYRDVNGDGNVTIADLQVFFQHREDPVVTDNARFFNFDEVEPPAVSVRDVQALFDGFLEREQ